mgnify:CR=1 FL=1
MIQIRPYRVKEFRLAQISLSSCNEELLHQCAYYPRPASFNQPSSCTKCSFSNPNRKCSYSHILIDTRTEVVAQHKVETLKLKNLSKSVKIEMLKMSDEEWEEFREFMRGRR